jgi:hypothetical protein
MRCVEEQRSQSVRQGAANNRTPFYNAWLECDLSPLGIRRLFPIPAETKLINKLGSMGWIRLTGHGTFLTCSNLP